MPPLVDDDVRSEGVPETVDDIRTGPVGTVAERIATVERRLANGRHSFADLRGELKSIEELAAKEAQKSADDRIKISALEGRMQSTEVDREKWKGKIWTIFLIIAMGFGGLVWNLAAYPRRDEYDRNMQGIENRLRALEVSGAENRADLRAIREAVVPKGQP
jgi:hypothetical protein